MTPTELIERQAAAKQEARDLAQWKKDGSKSGTRPKTPALDAIAADKEAGRTVTDAVKSTRSSKPELVAPVPGKGQSALAGKSQKHVDVLHVVVKDLTGVVLDPGGVIYRDTGATKVAAALVHAAQVSEHVYDTRLIVASLVTLLHDHPATEVTKRGAAIKLVDHLNTLRRKRLIANWSIAINLDGTLKWSTTGKTALTGLTARKMLAALPPV